MYRQDYAAIKRNCKLVQMPATSGMIQVDHSQFLARQAKAESATIVCRGKPPQIVPHGFLSGFTLAPGCQAETSSNIAFSIGDRTTDGMHAVAYGWSPQSDPYSTWAEVMHEFEKNDSIDAPPPIPRFNPITPIVLPPPTFNHAASISLWDVVMAIILMLLLSAGAYLGFRRFQHIRRRKTVQNRRREERREEPGQINFDLSQMEPVAAEELIRLQRRRDQYAAESRGSLPPGAAAIIDTNSPQSQSSTQADVEKWMNVSRRQGEKLRAHGLDADDP
jgi:hypothetical protein